jgi:periplasmic protein TonB
MSGPTQVRMASDLVALVRLPPEYPRTALDRGIEGYVDVLFTVTTTGSVTNPSVLAAEPAGIFEDAALAAVVRWRFQPQLLNGQPVAFPARSRLTFKLGQAKE